MQILKNGAYLAISNMGPILVYSAIFKPFTMPWRSLLRMVIR
jgi:hypothetical protein